MKKNLIRLIVIIISAVMILTAISEMIGVQATVASEPVNNSTLDISNSAEDTTGAASSMQRIIDNIFITTEVICANLAIIIFIVLANQYINASKDDIKKPRILHLVIAILLLGFAFVIEIMRNFTLGIE